MCCSSVGNLSVNPVLRSYGGYMSNFKYFVELPYFSIAQSVRLPVVESKLMPTFVTGRPQRAKRWR